jgi:hypothetical protein
MFFSIKSPLNETSFPSITHRNHPNPPSINLHKKKIRKDPEKCLRQTQFMNKLFDNKKNYGSEKRKRVTRGMEKKKQKEKA